MTAIVIRHEEASSITPQVPGRVAVPAELLPECTCILGDCDRDHDNE